MSINPNFRRIACSMLLVGGLVGATVTLSLGFVLSSPPATPAAAQSAISAAETQPDYQSEPDLAGLLGAIANTKMSEPLPGLVVGTVEYPPFGIRIHVFDFDQSRYAMRIVEQEAATGTKVTAFLASEIDIFAINGGFFERARNGTLSPSGLLIANGIRTSLEHRRAGSGIIYADEDGVAIAYRRDLRDRSRIGDAVQVGPILVDPGGKKGIYKNSFDRFNRSAICLRGRSFTAFVVEGGISLFQFADILSLPPSAGGFGCDVAINLDGGPSTQAVLRIGELRLEISSGTPVQNGLVVTRKPALGGPVIE